MNTPTKSKRKRKLSTSSPSTTPSIGKRGRKTTPPRNELCQCTLCKQHPTPNPETGLSSGGQYFSERGLREHLKLARDTETALKMISDSDIAGSSNAQLPQTTITDVDARATIQFLDQLAKTIERATDVVRKHCVFFAVDPDEAMLLDEMTDANRTALCSLDIHHLGNRAILAYQAKLAESRNTACLHEHEHSANKRIRRISGLIIKRVDEELISLNEELYNVWQRQSRYKKCSNICDSSSEYLYTLHSFSPIVLACLFLVLILHLVTGISMHQSSFLLHSLRFILELALSLSSSIEVPYIVRSIPLDIRGVIKKIDLEPQKTAYVCCPKCFCLYWINPHNRHDFPERCTHEELGETCGAKLRKSRKGRTVAGSVREYHTQKMSEYLARIYCRDDLQPYLQNQPQRRSSWGGMWWDIWDAPALRSILGPDNLPFLSPLDKSEGRLIFSLNMDGFNPFGNKEAGKKVSVGGIYMVCLNLPMSIRYDLENMYLVGVIPGPQEPSLHQINHLLRPLVDELHQLWKTGLYLTHTRSYPHGQLVRCALGPLVCDLPAARQMSGFSHFSSRHFCSECTQTRDEINNLDYKSWIPRNLHDHRKYAQEWKEAKTLKDREVLIRAHGVRWSELLRLPYWDPTKFTVIDSMHAFYLRMLQHHCRAIWGMGVDFDDGDGITFDPIPNQPSEAEMYDAHRTLECDTRSRLADLRATVLRQLCKDTTTLDFRGRKKKLLERLIEYRIRQGWFTADGERVTTGSEHANPRPQPAVLDFTGYPAGRLLRINFSSDADDIFSTKGKNYIKNLRKSDIITLIRYKVDTCAQSYDQLNKFTSAVLIQKIFDKQKELGIIGDDGNLVAQEFKKTRVLGRGVLKEIRNDMAFTMRPSWVSPPPLHPGEQQWGKFTADQWRTFCMQVLPITLTRLWGNHPQGSPERMRLDNFMELISAIKLATSHQMTSARIKKYEVHIEKYLKSLLELYPDINITPYQHLALHFGPMLERFGPTHAWRCNVFERYNYVMRQIQTNHRFGDLEKTLFHKFLEGQKLRSLLKPSVLVSGLQPFVKIFERFFKSSMAGTGLNNNLPYNDAFKLVNEEITWEFHMATAIPLSHQDLLRKWIIENDGSLNGPISTHAYFRNNIHRLGQLFTTRQESKRNSNIAYSLDTGSEWKAASISSIFSHTRSRLDGSKNTQTFVVVNNYKNATEYPEDAAFRRYPEIQGKIVNEDLAESEPDVLLSMDQVDSHFISCSFGGAPRDDEGALQDTVMVCLPLEKFHL